MSGTQRTLTERLRWYDASTTPPDHDRTVLVLKRNSRPFSNRWWTTARYDLNERKWRAEDWTAFPGVSIVLYWAEPEGPDV